MCLNFIYFFSFTCLTLSLCSSWRVELLIHIWVFEGQTEINMDCDEPRPKQYNKSLSHGNVDIFWSLLNENRQRDWKSFWSREIGRSECGCVWSSLYPSITLWNADTQYRSGRERFGSIWAHYDRMKALWRRLRWKTREKESKRDMNDYFILSWQR